MAASQSSAVLPAPFPQAFNSPIDREITRLDHLVALAQLQTCQREIPLDYDRYMPSTVDCTSKATVFDLETEMEYCLDCFEEVAGRCHCEDCSLLGVTLG